MPQSLRKLCRTHKWFWIPFSGDHFAWGRFYLLNRMRPVPKTETMTG
jgi:hypothetical protein